MEWNRKWMPKAGFFALGLAVSASVFAFGHWRYAEHSGEGMTHLLGANKHHSGGVQAVLPGPVAGKGESPSVQGDGVGGSAQGPAVSRRHHGEHGGHGFHARTGVETYVLNMFGSDRGR